MISRCTSLPCISSKFESDSTVSPPELSYKDWKVAMIVNVLYSKEFDGQVVNIVFDLSRKYSCLHWTKST